MKLTTQQAAQATGKSRSTIWRSAKSGKVSAERTATGDYVIDVSELERVFGHLNHPDTSHHVSTKPIETANETSVLRREVDLLREQIDVLKADKSDLQAERNRLLTIVEGHQRLLTDQRPPHRKWSWWYRNG
jgi:predicted site-specific integrase-resolvase